jgi:hypothetical protein
MPAAHRRRDARQSGREDRDPPKRPRHHIAHDGAPILLLQPTLEIAEAFSKDRLAPMVRDSPLRGLVKDAKSRDSETRSSTRCSPAGISRSRGEFAASLASRPIRIVLCDEVDRFPASAGTEGDPVTLAKQRSATFWRRKLVVVSTPTIKGARASRPRTRHPTSDTTRSAMPAARQALDWGHVRWPKDRRRGRLRLRGVRGRRGATDSVVAVARGSGRRGRRSQGRPASGSRRSTRRGRGSASSRRNSWRPPRMWSG